jgi:DNA-binding IclR family transcriptional regulator
MKTATEQREIRVQTVERSLMLLEVLAEQNTPLTLTRIGQLTKLNLSSAYRILNTLCRSGFVEREKTTGNYQLGLKAFLIGNAVLQRLNIREIALPHLNQFVQNNKESIYLSILSNQNVVYTDAVRTMGPIQIGIQTGLQVPACQTNAGKILLANLTKQEQQLLSTQYLQEQLISNQQSFLSELDSLKTHGFSDGAINFKDIIREISVPVYSYLGKCVGAISVFLQVNNSITQEQEHILLDQVNMTAKTISSAMGYREALAKQ